MVNFVRANFKKEFLKIASKMVIKHVDCGVFLKTTF